MSERSNDLPEWMRHLQAQGVDVAAARADQPQDGLTVTLQLDTLRSLLVDPELHATMVTAGAISTPHAPTLHAPTAARSTPRPASVPVPVPVPVPAPGTAAADPSVPTSERYRPGEALGHGGAAEVFAAEDHLLGRQVALKALRGELQRDATQRQRFIYEACTAGRLSHPGILPIHDIGALPGGRWFYTMPRLTGRSLREIIKDLVAEAPETVAAFPLRRRVEVLQRVCQTVAYAHDQGVIHRDLKPENLMLGPYGEVFVIDWGLAKAIDGAEVPTEHRTTPGTIMGTLAYMSPEQVNGKQEQIGPASDVWALGVILFELLTGTLPFKLEAAVRVMFAIVAGPLPDARERPVRSEPVPDALAELCLEAMTRSLDQRTLTAKAMAERLGGWLDGVEERARRTRRAAQLLARAEAEHAAWRAAGEANHREAIALAQAEAALRPSTPMPEREAVWNRRQQLEEHRLAAEHHFAAAVHAADSALAEQPTPAAQALLAHLYWSQAQAAEANKQAGTAQYFRALAAHHDTGALAEQLAATARLQISAPGITQLVRQAPAGPLLRDEPIAVGERFEALPAGSYVLRVAARGHMQVNVPLRLRGGDDRAVIVEPPRAFPGHEQFAWVPAGQWAVGGDRDAPRGLPAALHRLDGFAISVHPITMAEYAVFLNALAQHAGLDAARGHAPRSTDGSVCYFEVDAAAGRLQVPGVDADGDAWDPQWPALGIDAHDAEAYCAWRSARDGARYRLPTDIEWEVAARGVDGRLYPWGDGFDPMLCNMAESTEGRPMPRAVGAYPHDRSPFGVHDLAGSVIEWTATTRGDQRVQRGGACTSPAAWCRATARRLQRSSWNTFQFGFRVVRELTDGRVEHRR